MSYVTGISGNQISAAYAGYAPTNSAEVSAIASAYATGAEQVVTSLQYATSASAGIGETMTADTAVGAGARDMSAAYSYYGTWDNYNSSSPLLQVRMSAMGPMQNASSYPYYLYLIPYGVTNNGNASNTSYITGALNYGNFSGGMDDFIIAEGTASSIDPYLVGVTFNVTGVPFTGSLPAMWGTEGDEGNVVDGDEYTRPVFCVAGGYNGAELFELRYNVTAEMDFGDTITVSSVSGINGLGIYDGGVGYTVSTYSADWNSAYSLVSGVTALLDAI